MPAPLIRLRKRVGLPGVRLHDFRHFAASKLLAAGIPIRTVSGRLGHANFATTLGVDAPFIQASDRDAAEVPEGPPQPRTLTQPPKQRPHGRWRQYYGEPVQLTSNDRTLRQILSTYYFSIPRFQRPYSWTPENIEDLWQDAIQDSTGDYFVGSMVVYPKRDDTVAVIDGQQRLTTFLMLLCSIRDAADEQTCSSLANGTQTFIERTDENDQMRFVLQTDSSYPFLQDAILSKGTAELDTIVGSEEKALQAAYRRIVQYVRGIVESVLSDSALSEEAKQNVILKRLQEARDKLLGLRIVFIEVGTEDDATTIFVTLNSRGKDLEPADLVKAYLLQLMPQRSGLDRPLEKWQSIIDKFDASEATIDMTEFLLAVWRSRYEPRITEKKLMRQIRKQIKKPDAPRFLRDLVSDAELYRQVREPDYRKWTRDQEAAPQSLRFLRDFQISQSMPLLLSLMREFETGRIRLSQLKRALRAIEIITSATTFSRQRPRTVGCQRSSLVVLLTSSRVRTLNSAQFRLTRSSRI